MAAFAEHAEELMLDWQVPSLMIVGEGLGAAVGLEIVSRSARDFIAHMRRSGRASRRPKRRNKRTGIYYCRESTPKFQYRRIRSRARRIGSSRSFRSVG